MAGSDRVWMNGELVNAGEARVPVDDLGFTAGFAIFETFLWRDQHFYFFEQHLARMRTGAESLTIPWPPPWSLQDALAAYGAELGAQPRAVRAMLTRGRPDSHPNLIIAARPVTQYPADGVELRIHPEPLRLDAFGSGATQGSIKSTNRVFYTLAREAAQQAGAWDALYLTPTGQLAETSIANLFVVIDGAVRTPALACGCLAGVMRETALLALRSDRVENVSSVGEVEATLDRSVLAAASEVFLTNSTGRVIPVRAVQGIKDFAAPGPITRAVDAAIQQLEAEDRAGARSGA